MNADLTTVLVAILGVIGTLSSPLLGQRIAARAKQQEFDLQRQDRLETRDAAHQREAFKEDAFLFYGVAEGRHRTGGDAADGLGTTAPRRDRNRCPAGARQLAWGTWG